jgi:endonuclease/exonuclease/phosphatase family metal-dependent hydrolase
VEQIGREDSWLMVANTHFDHQSKVSRREAAKIIGEMVETKWKQYAPRLKNVLVCGDFNTNDHDEIFKELKIGSAPLPSLRRILTKESTDNDKTFNFFRPWLMTIINFIFYNQFVLDHIFVRLTDLVPVKFEVLRGRIASDHYPILGHF